jgi:hypothetical protein
VVEAMASAIDRVRRMATPALFDDLNDEATT